MKTDKQLLEGFKSQFNTGCLFNESQVLVLMGYARNEERRSAREEHKDKTQPVCERCGLQNSENCNTCSTLEKQGYSFETGT